MKIDINNIGQGPVTGEGTSANYSFAELLARAECHDDLTVSRDLVHLVSVGLLEQIGITGKGTVYILRRHKDAKDATKAPK